LAYIFVVQQNKNYDKTMLLTILFGSGSARLGIYSFSKETLFGTPNRPS
jgi:hypothetical protein